MYQYRGRYLITVCGDSRAAEASEEKENAEEGLDLLETGVDLSATPSTIFLKFLLNASEIDNRRYSCRGR